MSQIHIHCMSGDGSVDIKTCPKPSWCGNLPKCCTPTCVPCQESFRSKFLSAADTLGLAQRDMIILNDRYLDVVDGAQTTYMTTMSMYYLLTNVITIGGVILIAFTGLQTKYPAGTPFGDALYWICFGLAIIITICNKLLYSFSIPKKEMLDLVVLEKYKSEGWSFISGIDKYAAAKTIEDRMQVFCSRIENIKLKSVEALTNLESSSTNKNATSGGNASTTAKSSGQQASTGISTQYNGPFADILAAGPNAPVGSTMNTTGSIGATTNTITTVSNLVIQ